MSIAYVWDYRNRLTNVTITTTTTVDNTTTTAVTWTDYDYDAFNRLIGEDSGTGTTQTPTHRERYIYDGQNIILTFETNTSGDLQASDLAHRYLYGPGIGQILVDEMPQTGGAYAPLTDARGTVRDVLGVLETKSGPSVYLAEHLNYDAFGNIIADQQPTSGVTYHCRFTYDGLMLDATSGLYYMRSRWYDASTGRFISQDPLGFAGGDVNFYRFLGNDPVNGTDPLGLCGPDTGTTAPPDSNVNQSTGMVPVQSGGQNYYTPAGDTPPAPTDQSQLQTQAWLNQQFQQHIAHPQLGPSPGSEYWSYMSNPSRMDRKRPADHVGRNRRPGGGSTGKERSGRTPAVGEQGAKVFFARRW